MKLVYLNILLVALVCYHQADAKSYGKFSTKFKPKTLQRGKQINRPSPLARNRAGIARGPINRPSPLARNRAGIARGPINRPSPLARNRAGIARGPINRPSSLARNRAGIARGPINRPSPLARNRAAIAQGPNSVNPCANPRYRRDLDAPAIREKRTNKKKLTRAEREQRCQDQAAAKQAEQVRVDRARGSHKHALFPDLADPNTPRTQVVAHSNEKRRGQGHKIPRNTMFHNPKEEVHPNHNGRPVVRLTGDMYQVQADPNTGKYVSATKIGRRTALVGDDAVHHLYDETIQPV